MIDLEKSLVKGMSKKDVEHIASLACSDKKLFDELIKISLTEQDTRGMKASWIAATASELKPKIADKHFENVYAGIRNLKISGTQRELMKVLLHCTLDEKRFGKMIQLSFEFLQNVASEIAVKHYAKIFLEKACTKYPELIDEFILALEPLLEIHTPAWKVQVVKTIDRLNKRKAKATM